MGTCCLLVLAKIEDKQEGIFQLKILFTFHNVVYKTTLQS